MLLTVTAPMGEQGCVPVVVREQVLEEIFSMTWMDAKQHAVLTLSVMALPGENLVKPMIHHGAISSSATVCAVIHHVTGEGMIVISGIGSTDVSQPIAHPARWGDIPVVIFLVALLVQRVNTR
jgi:hypothetical protein